MTHPTREMLYAAVWFYNVQCSNRLRGWLDTQGQVEIDEAIATFRLAETNGLDIPSMRESVDWFNNG